MNRGANRQPIYKSNANRNLFYTILGEVVDRFKIEIHAFCLMDNHYHILMKTPHANLSKAMRHLDGIYTQRFNRRQSRDGALFRGRYKAILVDTDGYLLQVSRYIHLNPVAAKICKDPLDYKWSSYRSYVNAKQSIAWLQTSFLLAQMLSKESRQAYTNFVVHGIDEETRNFYHKKQLPSIYGKKSFVKNHLNNMERSYIQEVLTDINRTKPLPCKEIILKNVMDHFQISPLELHESKQGKRNLGKIIAIYLLRQLGHLSHKDISGIFNNIKPRSMSSSIGKYNQLIKMNPSVENHSNEIARKIEAC
jgi:REP element-mobilizing transposase RayT